ncbi:hypothetical protein Bbelb_076560 [Branchiostoma belcheri]|nr:hypothetical protein Bbelb_076560 [Branchiostoma belcheri]
MSEVAEQQPGKSGRSSPTPISPYSGCLNHPAPRCRAQNAFWRAVRWKWVHPDDAGALSPLTHSQPILLTHSACSSSRRQQATKPAGLAQHSHSAGARLHPALEFAAISQGRFFPDPPSPGERPQRATPTSGDLNQAAGSSLLGSRTYLSTLGDGTYTPEATHTPRLTNTTGTYLHCGILQQPAICNRLPGDSLCQSPDIVTTGRAIARCYLALKIRAAFLPHGRRAEFPFHQGTRVNADDLQDQDPAADACSGREQQGRLDVGGVYTSRLGSTLVKPRAFICRFSANGV